MNILPPQNFQKFKSGKSDASDSRFANNSDTRFDPGEQFQVIQTQLDRISQNLNSLKEYSSTSAILLQEIYYNRLKTIGQRLDALESIIAQSPTMPVEQTFVSRSYEGPMVKMMWSLFKWYFLCFAGFSIAIIVATALGAEQVGDRLLDLTLQGVLRLVLLPLIVFVVVAVLDPLRS